MPKKIKIIFITLLVTGYSLLVTNFALAIKLEDPLNLGNDPAVLYARIIKACLGVVGTLALVMFVWGGLQWMLSGGNAEQIKKGKETLLWSVLGMAIIFGAYALLEFIIGALTKG